MAGPADPLALIFSNSTSSHLIPPLPDQQYGGKMTNFAANVQPSGPIRFAGIDVLRGFAATSVLVYHVIEHMKWTEFPTSGPLLWFRTGFMGVTLFFVISGFVVTYSAAELYARQARGLPRRVRRKSLLADLPALLPHAHPMPVLVAPGLIGHPAFLFHTLTHVWFVHNLTYDTQGSINGVYWTVATEVQFYVLLGLL